MKLFLLVATAAVLAAGAAQAQSYRSVGASEGRVMFLEVGSDARQGTRATARVLSTFPAGQRADYMLAGVDIDCAANTFSFTFGEARRESGEVVARTDTPTAPMTAPQGTASDKLIALACRGTLPPDSRVYPTVAETLAAARRIIGRAG